MRKAAGIILIILGIFQVVGMIILGGQFMRSSSFFYRLWISGYWEFVYGALFVTGGILCIVKRYWGLCLISALLALAGGIYRVVVTLLTGEFPVTWATWILVVGAIISTIFISLRKKEWQEISDSVDGKVSYDG